MSHVRGVLIFAVLLLLPALAQAQPQVEVPVGTKVALRFLAKLDAASAAQDQRINFRVATHVIVDRRIAIREGTGAQGTVITVRQETSPSLEPRVRIAFIETTAVDGSVVRLARIDIVPGALRQIRDPASAVSTSAVGAILVTNGPVASLIRDGLVSIPAGAVGVTATTHSIIVSTE